MLIITDGESGREFTVILNHDQAVMLNGKATANELAPSDMLGAIIENSLGKSPQDDQTACDPPFTH